MYLSRILLDPDKRRTVQALNAPNLFHGAIESSPEDERTRSLWRIDKLNGQDYLLLLTTEKPDLQSIVRQFGRSEACSETREYEPLLNRIVPGSKWFFRLDANPVKSVRANDPTLRGVITPIRCDEEIKAWLKKKGEKNGFALEDSGFAIINKSQVSFLKKGQRPVSLQSVRFEGILEVTDTAAFKNALINGIGRGKAYGLGLMTVCRY